jgi:hypothetical protein
LPTGRRYGRLRGSGLSDATALARCGPCGARASNQMLRRAISTAKRTVTRGGNKRPLTRETRLENGPLASVFISAVNGWRPSVICPACWRGLGPLALMKSDDPRLPIKGAILRCDDGEGPFLFPDIERRQAKGKSSAEGRLERASESPSSDPNRDLTAPAMAIGSNPLSSTRKSARNRVGSVFQESLEVLMA